MSGAGQAEQATRQRGLHRPARQAQGSADALDAVGRTDTKAKALRERYGITSSDDAKPP
jgi:hypothetical protein